MNYYILSNNYRLQTTFTSDGVLAEGYDQKNPFPPMKYSWTKPRDLNRVYPSELNYIFKGGIFKLDYASFWDGYIVSREFKELIDILRCPVYKSVRLNVLNIKGERISNEGEYFFLDMRHSVQDVVDYPKSLFFLNEDMIKMRGLTIEQVKSTGDYFGNIKAYEKIALKEEKVDFNIFKLKDIAVHDLVCDEECYLKIRNSFDRVKCINLTDLKEYNERFGWSN
ncbi:hypothetical protein GCM10007415_23830 [Parapedobacter pyrenivorans]|uniref:Immunity protein 43 domain-containing protein n=1 Tax=Parapedobacter pyrenivorans TaxID=1305674 RepID=A0A917MA99_9SPHI|nr:hypothetical protein [Parapedobacter pyrenivorans]GGG88970.1 hypothetical protein GCM10007415_23830 [Parapedobacter pyrenivorans]